MVIREDRYRKGSRNANIAVNKGLKIELLGRDFIFRILLCLVITTVITVVTAELKRRKKVLVV